MHILRDSIAFLTSYQIAYLLPLLRSHFENHASSWLPWNILTGGNKKLPPSTCGKCILFHRGKAPENIISVITHNSFEYSMSKLVHLS